MIRAETEVEVSRPSEKVSAFISNIDRNPKEQSGKLEDRYTAEGSLVVGSTYDQAAKFLGRRIFSTLEVLEDESNRKI